MGVCGYNCVHRDLGEAEQLQVVLPALAQARGVCAASVLSGT